MTRMLLAASTVLLILIPASLAGSCQTNQCKIKTASENNEDAKQEKIEQAPITKLDKILLALRKQNSLIRTYQAAIEYIYTEDPDWIASKTTRKGNIYYKKDDKKSALLIRFDNIRLDDDEQEKRKVEYLFDGVWLKVIDHQNETVNSYQKAEKDKPVDAFELISRDFPLIGFTRKDDLRKNFDITLAPDTNNKENKTIMLKLNVKKGSVYAKNYTNIDFYIEKRTSLPARMITRSKEGDIYDINLLDAKINKKIKDSVFKLETPPDFRENIQRLKK